MRGRLGQHVALSGRALAIARRHRACRSASYVARGRGSARPLLAALGVVYTIPSLALFALLIPLLGLGVWTALTALVAYAQMILVRNIAAGFAERPAALRDAARGLGMTPRRASGASSCRKRCRSSSAACGSPPSR